ncbi:MAG: hypothetical protein EBU57_06935, partial [Alphaproteobacteria bacterium]|nr:hypothetical protein [Alphaproteobacteria bacterium]
APPAGEGIVAATDQTGDVLARQTARRLALAWGVHCVQTEDASSFLDMVIRASRVAEREEFAVTGDRLVITAGVPFGTPGRTNILRIATVGTDRGRAVN